MALRVIDARAQNTVGLKLEFRTWYGIGFERRGEARVAPIKYNCFDQMMRDANGVIQQFVKGTRLGCWPCTAAFEAITACSRPRQACGWPKKSKP